MFTPFARMVRSSVFPYEHEVARLWWGLSRGCSLPLNDGTTYQLVFSGYPGSSMGPDVHDAVLCTIPSPAQLRLPSCTISTRAESTHQYVGDVEFHVRASDWVFHQHHTDPRYNNVILHVVQVCDSLAPTLRQDGVPVPVCSLQDLSPVRSLLPLQPVPSAWPCQSSRLALTDQQFVRRLTFAGLLRFEQKVHSFVEQLHAVNPFVCPFDHYDVCLLPALAEALGYGRDRAFFRAAGLYLLRGGTPTLPEPLGRAFQPAPLDKLRLRVLSLLTERWRCPGVWLTLKKILLSCRTHSAGQLHLLRAAFCDLGLSLARADVLICNVVLPFTAAVALLEQDVDLAAWAQELYLHHPGLSSNRITRLMSRQLLLDAEPRGSCSQQGLQYVYQQTCREKKCAICIFGKNDL